MKPELYAFSCCRDYLKAWYDWKKEDEERFSYRTFAEQIGSVSYNYLQRVIAGTRSLSVKYIDDFARVLELSERERDLFELFVQFDRTVDSRERSLLMKRILIAKSREGKGVIREERLRFYENWYRPIIRELVTIHGALPFSEIGKKCIPPLSAKEAREAVQFLLDNSFLEKTDSGYRQISPTITTGDEVSSLIVRGYHADNLRVTADLIHDIPPEDREVSSLTFSVSEAAFGKMKEEIRQFRKRLIAIAQEDSRPERVYQASFQLLPRSAGTEVRDA